jgi:hypothetical protein
VMQQESFGMILIVRQGSLPSLMPFSL